ncbi:MAG: polysaccharide deacetylase [Eggerthellaceae bacterium]|nr:polysaccharide deacetylase [Eggerthellaceae bacterium]
MNVDDLDATASATTANLAWRDQDFAVDPTRTDWNLQSNGKKTVYLTIDDGPSENTQEVLDILDRYGCKATFFVVGHEPEYFYMIKEAYDRGHTIGLHTFSHDYATVYASVDAYYLDLNAIGNVVKQQIGYVPCFVRFPGGSSNAVSASYCPGIMSYLSMSLPQQGYQYYDWNMSVGDGDVHTADELVGFATEPTELDNIVLLMHDSSTKQTTVEALPRIIEHYQALGYTFEAIDRTTMVPHHEVAN